ncbi:long-chain-fatty-acid--CoA ligase [Massilia cavernae]|uniref:Long-chain-fatty-acid--CoA ligase n=1 Tax=Massilia cavernae TaxID=2320864 RepID=A0A418Y7T6_9BURK|nr:long-chain-fatty-acid--CoA ligase [Massilia cavernae]RJG27183.1 long-chain-fatty-acid--CoA ligase [Massilia cavernae]
MLGLMQYQSLQVSSLIEHACHHHPEREIVSRTSEGGIHRTTYGMVGQRSRQLANALVRLGVRPGMRVATLAWNGYRHMELYYAVAGIGAVLHTINPRLFPEQIAYIANHAEDDLLFFDIGFAGLVAQLAPQMKTVRGMYAMTDRAHLPDMPGVGCYEELIAAGSTDFVWPELDEHSAAALCYTSGTTGNPKGVLYSHRSTLLHAMAVCAVDGLGLSSADTALVVVPMFHVNAWGMPYAGALCGARLVFPGPALDGESVYQLLRDEGVTLALGVPTVWQLLFRHVEQQGLAPQQLALERVVIGGSAAPLSMIETFESLFGAQVLHAWGMTEMSPLGTVCRPLPKHASLDTASYRRLQQKQGRPVFGVRLKIVGDDGHALPHDGKSAGRLLVRGHWIASSYFGQEPGAALDANGYFDTGDIATIDPDGYMMITDRAKDVIKSGGEWISSIDLENAAMGHPALAEAAVIGIAHPTWQERPLLIAVRKPGQQVSGAELLAWLSGRVARWWCPDEVVFVDQLPHTATGKIQKLQLREQFRHYLLAQAPTLLIVPGLRGHVPDHWQTLLAEATPGARTVPPLETDGLSCSARVAALDRALAAIDGPVILVAHSAGVLTVAHWAARHQRSIAGALLVTPPDLEVDWPEPYPQPDTLRANGWAPLPRAPLPFPALVAASSNDHLASLDAARAMASDWGAELVELGPVGHLNPAAGYGPWPQAAELVARLVEAAAAVAK